MNEGHELFYENKLILTEELIATTDGRIEERIILDIISRNPLSAAKRWIRDIKKYKNKISGIKVFLLYRLCR